MSARRAERKASPLFELAHVLVRLNHIAHCIVNANHGIMWMAEKFCVVDCIRPGVPQATECQRIGNQIDAAFIFARAHFVNVYFLFR
jgi:hypothetical protein